MNGVPITIIEDFVSKEWNAFERLRTELDWRRIGNTPRSEYYTNEHGIPYTYGKAEYARTYESQPRHPLIAMIGDKVEFWWAYNRMEFAKLDVCFLNMYLS